jgi:hypothetical protein
LNIVFDNVVVERKRYKVYKKTECKSDMSWRELWGILELNDAADEEKRDINVGQSFNLVNN